MNKFSALETKGTSSVLCGLATYRPRVSDSTLFMSKVISPDSTHPQFAIFTHFIYL